MSLQDFLI
jgi:hypothetical protein